jgi:hypothetical protein
MLMDRPRSASKLRGNPSALEELYRPLTNPERLFSQVMESMFALFAVIIGLLLLDAAALSFGVDSRDRDSGGSIRD